MKNLYHGSNKRIKVLEPRKPNDPKTPMKAVYATDDKRRALGMALTNQKGSMSFSTKKPFIINFVKGTPKMKSIYLHYLNPKDFKLNRKGEYISLVKVEPIKIEEYKTSKLKNLWRKSSMEELEAYLKNRK